MHVVHGAYLKIITSRLMLASICTAVDMDDHWQQIYDCAVTNALTSKMLLAWLVLPLASTEWKQVVSLPNGKFEMKGDISTALTLLPSSARIFADDMLVTQNSLPSPGSLGYTPN